MIPQEQINEIRKTASDNIVSIINHYGPDLKISTHRGTKGKSLCPFHDEKTPSFHVNNTKGIYKCFGCGEGGDAVDFLIKYEGYGFIEAIRELAQYLNIIIKEKARLQPRKYVPPRKFIKDIDQVKKWIRKNGKAQLCFSKIDANELRKRGENDVVYLKSYRPPQVKLLDRYTDDFIIYPRGLNRRKFFIALKITAEEDINISIAKHADDQSAHWVDFITNNYTLTNEIRKRCLRILSAFNNPIKREVEQQYFSKKWNRNPQKSIV